MKIKPLSKEQLIISTDRLTRFKEPEAKYLRVFKDIISSNLIEPKLKKQDLDNLDYEELKELAQKIINFSIKEENNDFLINQRLYDYEKSLFKVSENTEKLLKNKINYKSIIKLLPSDIPNNLKWFKTLSDTNPNENTYGFPIKKIVLCEGITEETLLPEFAKICGFDFDQNGIHIVSAGGKNQVVKYFYTFAESLKIPIFVLLDSDAKSNLEEIKPKLREFDKIHILKCGEFEDLLPDELIFKTLNYETENISLAPIQNIDEYGSNVEFLEEFFKHRGLHEFKKAEFAQAVKKNISGIDDLSPEIKDIIHELASLKDNYTKNTLTN